MSNYIYPLKLGQKKVPIAIPNYPVEIAEASGQVFYIARENLRIFKGNSIDVFKVLGKIQTDRPQFKLEPLAGKYLNQGFGMMFAPKKNAIGKITQKKQGKYVLTEIEDDTETVVFNAIYDPSKMLEFMMKSAFSGKLADVLNSIEPLNFRNPSGGVCFSIQPIDTQGSISLSCKCDDVSRENEQRMILGAIALAFWWQRDNSSAA